MQAGKLRDRVVLKPIVVSGDHEDGHTFTLGNPFTVDAHVERFDEQTCRFIVRYRSGVAPGSHKLFWDDCIWTIVSAPHDQKRRQLTIECSITNLVEATHLTSTETEYVDAVPVLRPRE